ncbi:MAG: agmatinase [Gammaproteobacteria bacterium]|jgi:guanidinopropionase|nr:agmatinase [Gammaproteobacteria bacterium]
MAKISEERLSKYRELADIPSMQMQDTAVCEIFRRMEDEGAKVRDMRDKNMGMYMAPFQKNIEELDIACVGIPMENSIPLRLSTSKGPAALREWSQWYGPVHEIWKTIPFESFNVGDYGDIEFEHKDILPRVEQIYALYAEFSKAGVNTLSIGGEHTMTYPIMKALGEIEPLGMIHIDAHADTGGGVIPGDEDVLSINDASPFRHAVRDGVLDPERCIQIGIRGRGEHFWDFSHQTGMRVVTATEFYDLGVDAVIAEAHRIIGDGPCYITIDNDGIDPVDMPATGLPEPFGVSALDTRRILRGVKGLDIIGADFAELSPDNDPTGQSANISAALCFEMLCLLTESRAERSSERRKTHWNK